VRPHDVLPSPALDAGSLAELATRLAGELQAGGDQPGRPPGAYLVPLLLAADLEAWLLGWPAGFVTPAHDHGGSTVAVTVLEGALTEECLDLAGRVHHGVPARPRARARGRGRPARGRGPRLHAAVGAAVSRWRCSFPAWREPWWWSAGRSRRW
jgi:Cysteine dioxygenase type I